MAENEYPDYAADDVERRAEQEIYEDLEEDIPEEAFATEGTPPPEPTMRKGVAGSLAGAVTLLVAWGLSEIGIQMPLEIQAAVAVLVGAIVAYVQREY